MKTVINRKNAVLLILLAITTGISAQVRLDRNVEKVFKVGNDALIEVNSKFGNVEIVKGEGNSVNVVATIWAETSKESTSKELLDKMDVELLQADNTIKINSVFSDKQIKAGKDAKFRIDFVIKAPENINVNVNSRFGSVYIDENSGIVNLNISYGNLKVGQLSRGKEKPLNEINLSYSDASIDQAGWIKMNNAFSKANVQEAKAIVLISKYSGLVLDECSSLVTSSKYDTYSVGELNNFNGELSYSNLVIDELEKKLEYSGNYSSLNVKEVGQNFELIKVNNLRGGVKIGLNENSSFTFSGMVTRGDISIPDIEITSKKVENTTKFIEGKKGNNPTARIEVEAKEGGVKIYFN